MPKTCGQCGETKSRDRFHKRTASKDGLAACCKRCQWLYDLKRLNAPHRVKARAEYAKSKEGAAKQAEEKRAWSRRNGAKRKASIAVNNAVRDGRLIKPDRCSRCRSGGRIHGHHDDYNKPLVVTWLCSPCHREEHRTEYLHRKSLEFKRIESR